jgi:Fic family protein
VRSADFRAESPGSLLEISPGVAAFVPAAMPDELSLDHATVRLLSDAEHAIGRLVGAVGRTVNPFLVGSPLLHREAILSSRIEGTIATPEQLVLAELATPASADADRDDAGEVLNYIRAMRHGLKSKLWRHR